MPSFIFAEYSDKFFSPGVFCFSFSYELSVVPTTKMENMTHKTEEVIFFGMARSLRGLRLASAATEIILQVGIWEFRMEKLVSLIHYFALPVPLIGAFRRFIFFARRLLLFFVVSRNCERERLLRLRVRFESIPMRFATENDLFWNFLFLYYSWTSHTLNRSGDATRENSLFIAVFFIGYLIFVTNNL